MLTDIRRALRNLFRTPGFALVAILTLALGIGATTAMFSAVDTLLLRSLPYPQSDRLVMLWVDGGKRGLARQDYTNPADIESWRQSAKSVDAMGGFTPWGPTLTGRGEPRAVPSAQVTKGYLEAIGVAPAAGRWFQPEEDVAGAPNVVIVSHEFWQRELGGANGPGSAIELDGEAFTVVGVMPPGFEAPLMPDRELYVPLRGNLTNRGGMFLRVVGRLAPEASIESAQAEMAGIAAQLASAYPETNRELGAYVQPLREAVSESVRTQLVVLLGATAFVLLIACANLANLMLARAAGRGRELAVRAALGGSRKRIARQLLTESCVLSVLGALVGLGIAYALVGVMAAGLPAEATIRELAIDARVFAFALAIAIASGLLFGAAPAIATARQDLTTALREGGRGSAGGRASARIRQLLVIATFALALALTVGAGLFLKSLSRLADVDPGFDPSGGLTFTVSFPAARYPEESLAAKRDALRQQLTSVPGVAALGFTTTMPLSDVGTDTLVGVEGMSPTDEPLRAWYSVASPGYLESMGIAVKSGHGIDDSQVPGGPCRVQVNEAFVRAYLGGTTSAVGRRVNFAPREAEPSWCEIVGVVADLRFASLSRPQEPSMYLPLARSGSRTLFVTVRARAGDPASLLPALREAVTTFDPSMPIGSVRTLQTVVDEALQGSRLVTALVGGFAALALLLSAIGVYGVLAHTVTARRREIGVRMAVGADAREVVHMVLGSGLKLAGIGMALGLLLSLVIGRSLASLLYEVTPFDLPVFLAVAALLALVAAIATALPAFRAARVDPMIALRDE